MQMDSTRIQLERLRRHYDQSVKTYDQVSLLDLSHSLRIWSELKTPIQSSYPNFSNSISFKTGLPARKVLNAAKGQRYVFSYMPGGVVTFASNGNLASGPGLAPEEGDFSTGISVRASGEKIELAKFSYVSRCFEQPLIKALEAETVKRCNYIQWLGAEAVRLAFINKEGDYKKVSISREMIIKRVANTLEGSHASKSQAEEYGNSFDEPIHYLLEYSVGGLPLPYFILLKVAQDILNVADKYIVDLGNKA